MEMYGQQAQQILPVCIRHILTPGQLDILPGGTNFLRIELQHEIHFRLKANCQTPIDSDSTSLQTRYTSIIFLHIDL